MADRLVLSDFCTNAATYASYTYVAPPSAQREAAPGSDPFDRRVFDSRIIFRVVNLVQQRRRTGGET